MCLRLSTLFSVTNTVADELLLEPLEPLDHIDWRFR
jgi:hypothetical protein